MKLCIDCAHYRCNAGAKYATDSDRQCMAHPGDVDLVTGKERPRFCSSERLTGYACGPEAKLWEAKPAAVVVREGVLP